MRLEGKVALVTGGGRSIGRAICLGLAHEGADVTVNYERDARAAEEVVGLVRSLGRRALAVQADVSNREQVERLVAEVVNGLGHIDVLVNNAGTISRQPFLELSEENWNRVVDVNLKGVFLVGQAVAREMARHGGGTIVNVSSIADTMPSPGQAHYCAAKAGVTMLTRNMALELAPYGIRVNAVEPGLVNTEMTRSRFPDPDSRAAALTRLPLGRFGDPEEIAGAVVYLASHESSFATGAIIRLDGGRTLS